MIVPEPYQEAWLGFYLGLVFVTLTTLLVYTLVLRTLPARPEQAFANQMGVAPENGQLHQETNRRLAEINSLQRLTAALLQQHTLNEVLPLVCREAQELTGAQGARLLLLENENWLRVFHQTGTVEPHLERLPIGDSLSGLAMAQKTAVRINDPANSPLIKQLHPELTSLRASPLLLDGEVIGTLHVLNKPGGFTEDDTRILGLFADQAVIAIVNARLHEQAKQLAVVKERHRLARELHDSVTQVLYSMVLYADAARLALAADKSAQASENLQEVRQLARQAMADMRLLLFRLHPPVLEEEGLVAALQARLEAIEARAGLQVDLRVEGESCLPIATAEELYKISQEALNNVVKHAKAEHVTVHLLFTDQHCQMTIEDDGVGFDVLAAQKEGGLGLRSIAERVQQIGGTLQVESRPGQGTTLHIEVKTQQTEAMIQASSRLRPAPLEEHTP